VKAWGNIDRADIGMTSQYHHQYLSYTEHDSRADASSKGFMGIACT